MVAQVLHDAPNFGCFHMRPGMGKTTIITVEAVHLAKTLPKNKNILIVTCNDFLVD